MAATVVEGATAKSRSSGASSGTVLLDRPWFLRMLTLLLFGGLWELGATRRDSLMIPGFVETLEAIVALVQDPVFWAAFLTSNQALWIGLGISIVVGIPLGLATGRFRRLEQLSDPFISVLIVTPFAAITPIILMAFGLTMASRVILVVLFGIVMIIVQSRAGVRQVDVALIEMARSYGAGELRLWREVILPSAVPAIMTGIRLGLGRAFTGMVIGELLLVAVGLGGLVLNFRGAFRAAELYGSILLVIIQALLLVEVARRIEAAVKR